MIEILLNNKKLEKVLYKTFKLIVEDFNEHFKAEAKIERVDPEICKVNKLLFGEADKEEMWQKIIGLIKSKKVKDTLMRSEASLKLLSFDKIEVYLKDEEHCLKLNTNWEIKEAILKAVEEATDGIVPEQGVRFKIFNKKQRFDDMANRNRV